MKTNKKQAQLYQITNKRQSLTDYANSIFNRTLSMFEYKNLPETLPQAELEKQLQVHGYAVVFKYKDQLYSTSASLTGQNKSPYNQPTQAIINIPALNFNQTLDINKNCVLIKNDDLQVGLLPSILKHGTLAIENEITMLLADYNARIQTLISAGTDQTIQDAQKYINQIVDGNLSIIGENAFYQDLKTHNPSQNSKENFQDLIAYEQFIKSDLYNELGLSSLNNMKKERLITSEVDSESDQIYPFVDNMFRNRKDGINMVNKLFNGKIQVDFGSTWKDKADQRNTPRQQSTEPSEPTEPTQPTEPAEPTEPTQPTEPTEPTEPTQPTQSKDDNQK